MNRSKRRNVRLRILCRNWKRSMQLRRKSLAENLSTFFLDVCTSLRVWKVHWIPFARCFVRDATLIRVKSTGMGTCRVPGEGLLQITDPNGMTIGIEEAGRKRGRTFPHRKVGLNTIGVRKPPMQPPMLTPLLPWMLTIPLTIRRKKVDKSIMIVI